MKTRLIYLIWAVLTVAALMTFGYWLYWMVDYFQALPALQLRALDIAGLSVNAFLALCIFFGFVIFLPYFIVAQLIMLRRSQERFSLLAAIVLLTFGASNVVPPLAAAFSSYLYIPPVFAVPVYALSIVGWALLSVFVATYPDGKFVPRWSLPFAALVALASMVWTTSPDFILGLEGIALVGFAVLVAVGFGSIVYAQVWRYRHYYSAAQRQQVKWFVVGLLAFIATVIPLLFLSPVVTDPNATPQALIQAQLVYLFSQIGFIILPFSVGFAILRYRLWDIDVIIRRTLTYAILSAILVGIYFGGILALQRLFSFMTGGEYNEIVTVVSTLAIAALFIPLRSRIQEIIDRRFNRKKYDAQQVLTEFAETVRDETNLEQLAGKLVQVINETMQPKSVSVWIKKDG